MLRLRAIFMMVRVLYVIHLHHGLAQGCHVVIERYDLDGRKKAG